MEAKYLRNSSQRIFKILVQHPSNSLGGLKKNIEYLIGMERQTGSIDPISPQYISQTLNVSLEDVERFCKT